MHLGKVMVVFGTRPEAIKMAPVIHKLKAVEDIETIVTVTAQHRDMLDQVLRLFQIEPDYDLDLMKARQDLFSITTKVISGLQEILEKEKPNLLLVHGDTSTTFTAALAAFYLHIPVGHVEAGLRTRNKFSPFPEEMNRTLTGCLTDLHFAPTDTARENLIAEAKALFKIWVTGNTVIDALLQTVKPEYVFGPELSEVDFSRRILLVTTHRRENWGDKMRQIYQALIDIVEEFSDVEVVFPVHLNPVVKDIAYEMLKDKRRIHLTGPLDYEPFVNLMNNSYLVMTDSGGLQEEAPSLGKPVLVLRDSTERPEAVEAGTVKLVGTTYKQIYEQTKILLTQEKEYEKMARAINPYGDGKASERIVNIIIDVLYARKGVQP